MSVEKVAEVFMKYDKDQSGQIEFLEWLQMFRCEHLGSRQHGIQCGKSDYAMGTCAVVKVLVAA